MVLATLPGIFNKCITLHSLKRFQLVFKLDLSRKINTCHAIMERLFVVLIYFSVVAGYLHITSPPSRGFSPSTNTQPPCGGFNTIGQRSIFSVGTSYNSSL